MQTHIVGDLRFVLPTTPAYPSVPSSPAIDMSHNHRRRKSADIPFVIESKQQNAFSPKPSPPSSPSGRGVLHRNPLASIKQPTQDKNSTVSGEWSF
jgi:hypothetical protein